MRPALASYPTSHALVALACLTCPASLDLPRTYALVPPGRSQDPAAKAQDAVAALGVSADAVLADPTMLLRVVSQLGLDQRITVAAVSCLIWALCAAS